MAKDKLRFALIGCGDVGLKNVLALEASRRCELRMIIDENPDALACLPENLQAKTGTDVSLAFESPDVDAVFVATPHHHHADLCIRALRSGKHVVVEKPLAHTLSEARRMCQEAESANVRLSVCHPRQYDVLVQKARGMIEQGKIGKTLLVVSNYYRAKGREYWSEGLTGRTRSEWRMAKQQSGGGVLMMNGVHHIDTILSVIGKRVKSVISHSANLDSPGDIEDTASLIMGLDDGLTCYLQTCVIPGTSHRVEDRFIGTKGEIIIKPKLLETRIHNENGTETQTFEREGEDSSKEMFFDEFARATLSGLTPPSPASYGLHIMGIVTAAYRSQESSHVELI